MKKIKIGLLISGLALMAGSAQANIFQDAMNYARNAASLFVSQTGFKSIVNKDQGLEGGYQAVVSKLTYQPAVDACTQTVQNIHNFYQDAQTIYTSVYASSPNSVHYQHGAANLCVVKYSAFMLSAKQHLAEINAADPEAEAGRIAQICSDLNNRAKIGSTDLTVPVCEGMA